MTTTACVLIWRLWERESDYICTKYMYNHIHIYICTHTLCIYFVCRKTDVLAFIVRVRNCILQHKIAYYLNPHIFFCFLFILQYLSIACVLLLIAETGEAHDKEQNKQVHTVLSDPKQLSLLQL